MSSALLLQLGSKMRPKIIGGMQLLAQQKRGGAIHRSLFHWDKSLVSTGAGLSKNGSTVPLSSIEKRWLAADGSIIRVSSRVGRQLIVDPACNVLTFPGGTSWCLAGQRRLAELGPLRLELWGCCGKYFSGPVNGQLVSRKLQASVIVDAVRLQCMQCR